LAFCLGCENGPEIASVEGTVTMDGKPLPNATILFIPENGRPAGGRTDDRGHYVLNFTESRDGAIPGKNTIQITTAAEATEAADGTPIPAQREIIPTRYNSQSALEFTVEAGKKNVANFDLESKGSLPAADTY
jgi:hypothetical protein